MSSRHPPPAPSRTTSSSHAFHASSRDPASSSHIRRNLFGTRAPPRRPGSALSSHVSDELDGQSQSHQRRGRDARSHATGSSSMRGFGDRGTGAAAAGGARGPEGSGAAGGAGGNEIVARDEQGAYRVDVPAVLTGLPVENEEAEEARNDAEERLLEIFKARNQSQIEMNELKASLATSLQAKVSSLDDDRWMFEAEDPILP